MEEHGALEGSARARAAAYDQTTCYRSVSPTLASQSRRADSARLLHADGHVDLEILSRYYYANDLDAFDLRKETRGQVDFPRMRKGKIAGL